jgi:cell division protein FtsB
MQTIPINLRRVLVVIGIIILIFIVLEFNRRLDELNNLTDKNNSVRTEATQIIQTQQALETAVGYAKSTAAVEEWARTDGHYIKDGDLPVVPVEAPGAAPLEMTEPTPTPVPPQNWEIWLKLFFGK